MVLKANRPSKGDEARRKIMEDITDISEPKRRLNVDVEDSLYRRIKVRVAEEDKTITEITRDLWIEYLSR